MMPLISTSVDDNPQKRAEQSGLLTTQKAPVHNERIENIGYLISAKVEDSICVFPLVSSFENILNDGFELSPKKIDPIIVANDLFAESRNLNHFESSVLDDTLDRLAKSRPSLPGRK
jgi:hypothetical protein